MPLRDHFHPPLWPKRDWHSFHKDRPASREAFVSKCVTYLQRGVGLIVVDVVTERNADLHGAILLRLGHAVTSTPSLYAAAYNPVTEENHQHRLKIWLETLEIQKPLPTLPLYLMAGPHLQVDLEASYERTRREMRLGVNGA